MAGAWEREEQENNTYLATFKIELGDWLE